MSGNKPIIMGVDVGASDATAVSVSRPRESGPDAFPSSIAAWAKGQMTLSYEEWAAQTIGVERARYLELYEEARDVERIETRAKAAIARARRLIIAAANTDNRGARVRKLRRAVRIHRQVYGRFYSQARWHLLYQEACRQRQFARFRAIFSKRMFEISAALASAAPAARRLGDQLKRLHVGEMDFVPGRGWVDPEKEAGDDEG